jgi:hypothetical protein
MSDAGSEETGPVGRVGLEALTTERQEAVGAVKLRKHGG